MNEEAPPTVVTVGSGGRITVPSGLRQHLGIDQGSLVTIQFQDPRTDDRTTSYLELGDVGRVTVPQAVREYLGLDEGDTVEISVSVE